MCARPNAGGARHRRRAVDAIRPHVRDAGDSDHSGELAAGQGARSSAITARSRIAWSRNCAGKASRTSTRPMRFSRRTYWARPQSRASRRPPASSDDFHVARPRGLRLDAVFRLEETRTVSNDWVVRYANRLLAARATERPGRRRAARSWSVKTSTGQLEIRYRDRVDAVDGDRRRRSRRRRRRRGAPTDAAPAARACAPPRPCADHPWRHGGFKARWRGRRAALAAGDRDEPSLWKLPEPWTRRARAHRSLENYRTVFHSSHRHHSHGRGHFYRVKNGDISNEL